jgi:hypothetical protein
MRIFALETDIQKIKDRFLAHGEREIFTATPHLFRFLTAIIREFVITVLIVVVAFFVYSTGMLEVGTVVLSRFSPSFSCTTVKTKISIKGISQNG